MILVGSAGESTIQMYYSSSSMDSGVGHQGTWPDLTKCGSGALLEATGQMFLSSHKQSDCSGKKMKLLTIIFIQKYEKVRS